MNWDTNLNDLLHQGENLLSIGVEIPSALRMRFDRCKALKPIVYSIEEHLSLLEEMAESSDDRECVAKFGFLVENVEAQVFQNLEEVLKLTWSMIVLEMSLHQSEDPLANAFQVEKSSLTQISVFQESVHQLHHLRNAFHNVYDVLYNRRIPALLSCEYSLGEISAGILEIQSDVNTILTADFWNLDMLVETVNRDISQ
ncbi:hypothetical protein HF325_004338 [Metschnikowia pulcherrima]|uniref:Uncharacterized protein n=1 Tax=Metschnikowia pulcherrima TaxID=27326 RepID=A0A8H7GSM6_9ASCO|nr:hypothetical protein HF325_004338 [Metschnikowia pulcherrima]